MNTKLKTVLGLLVLLFGIVLASCTKDEPITPPQPAVKIHFASEQVEVSLGGSVSVPLLNFKGTLAQEGKVEGFKVSISGNIVTISPEAYKPGTYTFVFKGEGKTYPLKVILKELSQFSAPYGLFTSANVPMLLPKYTAKKFKSGKMSSFLMSENQDNPKQQYVQISDIQHSGEKISFVLRAKGIITLSDGKPYLPDGEYRISDGIRTSPEGVSPLRIFAKLSGRSVTIILPN